MNNRLWRTIIVSVTGLLLAYVVAWYIVPRWPDFCDQTIPDRPCSTVKLLTGFGYTTIVLGILTLVLGPIISSLAHLAVHGHDWETPRGTETVTSNLPILIGAIYLGVGLTVVILA